MERSAEISFSVTYDDDPEKVETLRRKVSVMTGLPIAELAGVEPPDLVRYVLDTKTEALANIGVTVQDSSAQSVDDPEPEAGGPRM